MISRSICKCSFIFVMETGKTSSLYAQYANFSHGKRQLERFCPQFLLHCEFRFPQCLMWQFDSFWELI